MAEAKKERKFFKTQKKDFVPEGGKKPVVVKAPAKSFKERTKGVNYPWEIKSDAK